MKTENIDNNGQKSTRKLDSLSEAQLTWVLETASHSRMIEVVEALKSECGILVSVATLSRYLKRHRESELLEDGANMQGAIDTLAQRGENGALRKGTLEAVRQRLYERVLTSNDPTEALEMYNSMLKEESKLRELEIEARKVAVAEEQVRLQAMKLKSPTRAIVESSIDEPRALPAGPSDRELQLQQILDAITTTLNNGGPADEKVVQARSLLVGRSVITASPSVN